MPSALQIELANSEYAALSDQQAAATINTKTARALVALANWASWPYEDATYFQLSLASAATLPVEADANFASALALKAAATTMLGYITNPKIERVDMDLPATQAAISALVAAGVISQDFVTRVDALANVPWWKSIGMTRPVTVMDVKNTRGQRSEVRDQKPPPP